MHHHLIVPPEVSRAIGAFGLSRAALIRLLIHLRTELEDHADRYRQARDPAHPDLYFWFEVTLWDQGRPRSFRFTVDDARAAGYLFLIAAEEF